MIILFWISSFADFIFTSLLSCQDVGPLPTGDGEDYYVPPTQGTSQAHVWVTNSQLPVDHVVAGSFDTAARVSTKFLFQYYMTICLREFEPRSYPSRYIQISFCTIKDMFFHPLFAEIT